MIKLRHFDDSKLFSFATERGFARLMKDDFLAINPDHVCAVTVAKYRPHHTTHFSNDNKLYFVFLPVIIRMVDGSTHDVLEDFESVVRTLSGEAGSLYINRGFTIDRLDNQYNTELVPRTLEKDYYTS